LVERKKMMQAWADYLEVLRLDIKVVPIRRKATPKYENLRIESQHPCWPRSKHLAAQCTQEIAPFRRRGLVLERPARDCEGSDCLTVESAPPDLTSFDHSSIVKAPDRVARED
jgi:hypothetical protein